jgi:Domain of unknown function (DUF4440)
MALYVHGYDNVAMYDSSWNEWHQDEANPRDDVEAMMARSPKQSQRERLERFFGRMDSYSLVPEDFETSVVGEVGMARGTFIESWQDKGQPPEQARVRFSNVFIKGTQGWQGLQYHR